MQNEDAVPAERREQLARWARWMAGPQAVVREVKPLPGHAGISLGFTVDCEGPWNGRYVIRFAPEGVRKQGSTDVLRQVRLLEALVRSGARVPELVWSTDEPRWFGTDVIVQRWVDGGPLHMFDASVGIVPNRPIESYVDDAVDALAAVHAVDWERHLTGWDTPRSASDEIGLWSRLLPKHPDPAWSRRGESLAEKLRDSDPGEHRIGLFHGDFQTNNLLYAHDTGELTAIVDWELAAIGPVGTDVGWLVVMTDPVFWGPVIGPTLRTVVSAQRIRERYEAATREVLPDFDWYVALGAFRYGAISGHNVRLHRNGRRVDPFNESMSTAVMALFDEGLRRLS